MLVYISDYVTFLYIAVIVNTVLYITVVYNSFLYITEVKIQFLYKTLIVLFMYNRGYFT